MRRIVQILTVIGLLCVGEYTRSAKGEVKNPWTDEAEQVAWYQSILNAFPYYLEPDYEGTGFKPERFRREIPAPYVHPRLLFGPEELPTIRERLRNTESGRVILEAFRAQTASLDTNERERLVYHGLMENAHYQDFEKALAEIGQIVATKMMWKSFLILMDDDAEAAERHAKALVSLTRRSHAKFKSFDLSKSEMESLLNGLPPVIRERIPGTKHLQMYLGDLYNGTINVQYDFLYNWMDDEQRRIIREFIAETTSGIWAHGMGSQRTGGNWGVLFWLGPFQHMAIEGEEGYDPKVAEAWKDIHTSFFTYDFSEQGATYEPLGKGRVGAEFLPFFARRGLDVAAYPHVPKAVKGYYLASKQPFGSYFKTGGGLGSALGNADPVAVVIMRHLYPDDPLIAYLSRVVVGEDYAYATKGCWSTHFAGILNPILTALYLVDHDRSRTLEELLRDGGAPVSFFDPQTGLFTARSDWSEDALWVHTIANTALAQGHLANESGTISFSAHGRVWGDYANPNISGPLGTAKESRFFSLVNIDRRGQSRQWSKMTAASDQGLGSFAVLDLKNAWDWTTVDGARAGDAKVLDESTWRDSTPLYEPKITGYDMPVRMIEHWRNPGQRSAERDYKAPHVPVQTARRTVGLVRGQTPYLIVADDYDVGDKQSHLYEWLLQLPYDVDIERSEPGIVILREQDGPRRLLLRIFHAYPNLAPDMPSLDVLAGYGLNNGGETGRRIRCHRLRVPVAGERLASRIIVYPFREGDALPSFEWDAASGRLDVHVAGQHDTFTFRKPSDGPEVLSLSRGGARLNVVEGEVQK